MSQFTQGCSPGINALLEAAEVCYRDPSQVEIAFLPQHVNHIQEFRRALERQFADFKQRRPRTLLYRQSEPALNRSFEEFRQGMKQIEQFLTDRSSSELASGCQMTRNAVEELVRISQDLRKEEDTFAPACEAPPIREIVVMLDAVVRREMDFEPLVQRIEMFGSSVQQFGRDLSVWKKAPFESDTLESMVPEVEQATGQLESILTDLLMACRGGAYFELDLNRRPLVETGQKLWDLQKSWMAALVPPVICPRCNHSNLATNKICDGCQAQLVGGNQPQSTSTFSVKTESENETPRLTNVVRIEEIAEQFSQGEVSGADFEETLNWFLERVNGGRQLLKSIKVPEIEGAEGEAATRVHALVDRGGELFQQAVQTLKQFRLDASRETMDRGLAQLWSGENFMLDAEKAGRAPVNQATATATAS